MGDPVRDAFRTKLQAVLTGASITWPIKDVTNTDVNPDGSESFFELEFLGGSEDQQSFGAPGSNWFLETGQVNVHIVVPLGRNQATAESYVPLVRAGFRGSRFAAGSLTVRIDRTGPMGGGETAGGMWAETIALEYQVTNIG